MVLFIELGREPVLYRRICRHRGQYFVLTNRMGFLSRFLAGWGNLNLELQLKKVYEIKFITQRREKGLSLSTEEAKGYTFNTFSLVYKLL